jgi:hypothetical protein
MLRRGQTSALARGGHEQRSCSFQPKLKFHKKEAVRAAILEAAASAAAALVGGPAGVSDSMLWQGYCHVGSAEINIKLQSQVITGTGKGRTEKCTVFLRTTRYRCAGASH